MALQGFGTDITAVVFGAGGGIGGAFVEALAGDGAVARVHAVSRRMPDLPPGKVRGHACDPLDDTALERTVAAVTAGGPIHLAIVATGILHGEGLAPEKTWRQVDAEAMARVLAVNTIAPTLIAKHVLPALAKDRRACLAALSARVGSIGDNRLGGWVSYRASKAALNMMIRTFSIELARVNPGAAFIGLHPGTVETGLSEPFRGGVPRSGLFTPERSVAGMLTVIDRAEPAMSGRIFDYAGKEVLP